MKYVEKIFRIRGDVGVAFSSVVDNRCAIEPTSISQVAPENGTRSAVPQGAPNAVAVSGTHRPGLRAWIKAALRVPARFVYRCLRPFARPVMFRLRSYLLRELRAEIGAMHRDLLQEVQMLHAASAQERKSLAAQAVRMSEVARASLQEEIRNASHETESGLKRIVGDVETLGSSLDALTRSTAAGWNALNARLSDVGRQVQEVVAELAREASVERVIRDVLEQVKENASQLAGDVRSLIRGTSEASDELIMNTIAQLARDASVSQASALSLLSERLDRIELYAMASTRRFAISCGNEGVLVRTEAGYVMCPATDAALIAVLVESGDLERGTRVLIQRVLKPGDVFIDVGANVGMHTLAAARAMEGRGQIIAFEPFPATVQLLTRSVWLNGFSHMTEIHQAAVSTSPGPLALHLGKTSGHHSLLPLFSEGGDVTEKVDVPVKGVDDVVGDRPVTLMKIDVEGAELQVLETARHTIKANPEMAIIVEFGRSHLVRAGLAPERWLAAFTSMGLDFRVINEGTGKLECWTVEQLQGVDSVNLLFARPGVPLLDS